MNDLKIKLGIDEWLNLIKEDKNLNGAYISLSQYIYKLEQELEDETLNKQIAQGHRKEVQMIELQERKELKKYKSIVDELEKVLKEEVKGLYNEENPMLLDETYIKYATERKMAYMYILNKLNELKGDNK